MTPALASATAVRTRPTTGHGAPSGVQEAFPTPRSTPTPSGACRQQRTVDALTGLDPQDRVVICPPHTLIARLAAAKGSQAKWRVGAQDCHSERAGAHTGDVSAIQIAEAGADAVIIGHSERRTLGESDAIVRRKVEAALAVGLEVILCIGETQTERSAGMRPDCAAAMAEVALPAHPNGRLCLACEPVWCIGAGCVPTLDELAEVVARLRTVLAAKQRTAAVVYGGSVTERNTSSLKDARVDGLLVDGASLSPSALRRVIDAWRGR